MMTWRQRPEGQRAGGQNPEPAWFRPASGLRLLLACVLVLALAGCGASRSVHSIDSNGPPGDAALGKELLKTAKSQLGVKYRFGGKSPDGFDCSGLAWWTFKQNGIKLQRESFKQFQDGKTVRRDALKAGDLVFFTTYRKGASHVGIYDGKGGFVHAPSEGKTVRHTEMDNPWWKKRYVGARRYW